MADNRPRIGITMRQTKASGSAEVRDALARDWAGFMEKTLPESLWMPIPNLGAEAASYCRNWHLDGLILTGGDDIGATPERDATERSLIDYFFGCSKPVLGVCRGLQMLWTGAGGRLVKAGDHAGTRHAVTLTDPHWLASFGPGGVGVNSFHTNVLNGPLPMDWRCGAIDDDGRVEAIIHQRLPIVGVMWHPEREAAVSAIDRALFRSLFLTGKSSP